MPTLELRMCSNTCLSKLAVIPQLSSQSIAAIHQRIAGTPDTWTVDEIGDGNVNLVFLVSGPDGQVVVKQALPYVRSVGESWPLTARRSFFERKALEEHAVIAPEYVPRVLTFEEPAAITVMEFLGSHIVLRNGLMQSTRYPRFSDHITDFLAKTLFFTSDLFLSAAEKKAKVSLFNENVELCKITEDLIFTDPYLVDSRNRWTSPQLDSLAKAFSTDRELKVAITELKAKFLTASEALIHGDLHTGSIMVNQQETKIIDPEFACYGPMGFDVGLLLANFVLSYFSQAGLGGNPAYEQWLLQQVTEIWSEFARKFSALWDSHLQGDYLPQRLLTNGSRAYVIDQLRTDYLARVFDDSLGFAASEVIRRVLGFAHVADMERIEDPERRAVCESHALHVARELLVSHRKYTDIATVLDLIRAQRTWA